MTAIAITAALLIGFLAGSRIAARRAVRTITALANQIAHRDRALAARNKQWAGLDELLTRWDGLHPAGSYTLAADELRAYIASCVEQQHEDRLAAIRARIEGDEPR